MPVVVSTGVFLAPALGKMLSVSPKQRVQKTAVEAIKIVSGY